MTDARDSAHPSGDHERMEPERGLTKREIFAMAAMQGYIASGETHWQEIASEAVQQADLLIEALNKTK